MINQHCYIRKIIATTKIWTMIELIHVITKTVGTLKCASMKTSFVPLIGPAPQSRREWGWFFMPTSNLARTIVLYQQEMAPT